MAQIGFIGLGHMGNPMVKNLLAKGHSVVVYDLCQQAIERVQAVGAQPARSIAEIGTESQIVFTMLQTGEQVKQVCLEEQGLFNSINPECLYIDSSSIDVQSARDLHQIALERDIAMVDAPVSGGVAGAEAGTLTFMVGGEEKNFLRAKPYLDCLGKNIIHAGVAGNGQAAKICNNMILGISMIAAAEAFVLAKKLGVEPAIFFDIASHATGQCWAISTYCPMPGVLDNVPSNRNFEPGFAASMMLKDLGLSQEAALKTKTPTPLGAEATALYSLFVGNGNADLDFSGIIKMVAGEELDKK